MAWIGLEADQAGRNDQHNAYQKTDANRSKHSRVLAHGWDNSWRVCCEVPIAGELDFEQYRGHGSTGRLTLSFLSPSRAAETKPASC
jgi:hypothetical protein